ncbi:MAG: type II methionyl aminopeptidase [Nanoarchaeota archaeon]
MDEEKIKKYIQAGKIAANLRKFIKSYIKEGMLLTDIVKKIKDKIEDEGAISAFPPTISINDIAAHYHPLKNEETKIHGLAKIDFGICVDGYIADTALSIDLTENNEHKKLIEASELALENAIKLLKKNPTLNDIGKTIQETIKSKGFSPVINLSGHSLEKYNVHAGITIPNYANGNNNHLEPGAYAIEPFATNGEGKIYSGSSGNIYQIKEQKNPRSQKSREILDYIKNKYKTLPFSARWLAREFDTAGTGSQCSSGPARSGCCFAPSPPGSRDTRRQSGQHRYTPPPRRSHTGRADSPSALRLPPPESETSWPAHELNPSTPQSRCKGLRAPSTLLLLIRRQRTIKVVHIRRQLIQQNL